MHRKFLIVGLRGLVSVFPGGASPGYLYTVTENHRKGFRIDEVWYAWCSDPMYADTFENESEAEQVIFKLIKNDNGFCRYSTVVPIYI